MRLNTGQCLPLSIIAQEAVDYVRANGLDPARTALWLPRANMSCNIGMFIPLMKSLMEAEGGGMERMEIYCRGCLLPRDRARAPRSTRTRHTWRAGS